MAYVAITARGGSEEDRESVRAALSSYFESSWGELVVELTCDDAARWCVEHAWWKQAGGSQRRDCHEQVANALAAGHIAFRRSFDPALRFPGASSVLW
jgi:hypothetical protein